MSTATNPT